MPVALSRCRRALASVALLAIILRVLVPAGFMPAPLSDGWYLSLCPQGHSSAAVTALPDEGGHHLHHAIAESGKHSPQQMAEQCELGDAFAGAVILDAIVLAIASSYALALLFTILPAAPVRPIIRLYDSRGPPTPAC